MQNRVKDLGLKFLDGSWMAGEWVRGRLSEGQISVAQFSSGLDNWVLNSLDNWISRRDVKVSFSIKFEKGSFLIGKNC